MAEAQPGKQCPHQPEPCWQHRKPIVDYLEMSFLTESDPQISQAIGCELKRQQETINLIAFENHASQAVLEAQGTALTDKYAEGYHGQRYYAGYVNVDTAESLATQRAKELFKAEYANVQPHSGSERNSSSKGDWNLLERLHKR